MAEKAAGPEGASGKAGPGKKPVPPDQAAVAGQARPRDPSGQPDTAAHDGQPKFREALERKRAREAGNVGAPRGKDAGKIHGAHGPAGNRRSFRRKSG